MKNIARPKNNKPQGGGRFQNIPISHRKMPPRNYCHPSGEGAIHFSKCSTCKETGMGEPSKLHSSETIGVGNAATTTRGRRITNQVHLTDDRGPRINVIHRHIRGRMRSSVDGRYRGPGKHFM